MVAHDVQLAAGGGKSGASVSAKIRRGGRCVVNYQDAEKTKNKSYIKLQKVTGL